jgi:hypothetical protein
MVGDWMVPMVFQRFLMVPKILFSPLCHTGGGSRSLTLVSGNTKGGGGGGVETKKSSNGVAVSGNP